MQVPEKLALIGGSILLASTLIFTLKSQASQILPKVGHSISTVYQEAGKVENSNSFDSNFQDAKKDGEQTGNWGTSKYYIDKSMNMHVGKGTLQDHLRDRIGNSASDSIRSINFDEPVQAPQNSAFLLSTSGEGLAPNSQLVSINGMNKLSTNGVTDMSDMFSYDNSLSNVDLSHIYTSQVTTFYATFWHTKSLRNLNNSNWNMSKHPNTYHMYGDR